MFKTILPQKPKTQKLNIEVDIKRYWPAPETMSDAQLLIAAAQCFRAGNDGQARIYKRALVKRARGRK